MELGDVPHPFWMDVPAVASVGASGWIGFGYTNERDLFRVSLIPNQV